jgi:hypothetical protein
MVKVKPAEKMIEVAKQMIIGKKIKDVELIYNHDVEEYSLESITLEDNTVIELWGRADDILFIVDDREEQK